MGNVRSITLPKIIALLATLLLVKVTMSVVWEYRNYLPPNFQADFLLGRESYFHGAYQWAFYVHLAAGPPSLILGALLVSERFRRWSPAWHRRLGRVQVLNVLMLVAPSGLWMAWYAMTGWIAGLGLATLAAATALCVALGWRAVLQRQFAVHRVWMERAFVLLCSAVVIRVIGGAATVIGTDAQWIYPASCWASWLVPLMIFEFRQPILALAQ